MLFIIFLDSLEIEYDAFWKSDGSFFDNLPVILCTMLFGVLPKEKIKELTSPAMESLVQLA